MTATTPGSRATTTSDGKTLRLTNPGKIMYSGTGLTKAGVIDYYTAVSDVLLVQLRDRVVTRIRYPDGTGGQRFFEKNTSTAVLEWIRRFLISASPETGKPAKRVCYPVIDTGAGLLWMANQAALELHTPQWRVGPRGGVRNPDRLVIDLDPGEGAGLDECARIAHLVAARLTEDDLHAFPVTSGSKGIHLYAAVNGKRSALAVQAYVQKIAHELARQHPDDIVAVIGKEERTGKVMLDWSQNHPARSTATPCSLRDADRCRTSRVGRTHRWTHSARSRRRLGEIESRWGPDDSGSNHTIFG
ncbi:MAG: DNA polymerase domain-containing protein [Thermomicrobiales bacterium]